MATIADELAVKAVDIEQDKVLKPIGEAIESGLAKVPGEPEFVEEELKPIERSLGGDVPLPKFDAPKEGFARIPKPGGGTEEVPITTSNVDPEGRIIGGDSFINDLDAKLQELRKQRLVKTKAFNFQLDAEGNLRLPKNPRSKAAQTLFKQISEDPQFTAEEREHLLGSFSPKTLQLIQGQELDAIIPAPDLGTVALEPVATDLTAEELGLTKQKKITQLQEEVSQILNDPTFPAERKGQFRLLQTQLQRDLSDEDLDAITKIKDDLLKEPKVGVVGQPLTAGAVEGAEFADTAGVLSESELKSLPKGKEPMDPLPGSIFAEQPGDRVPAGEPFQLDIPDEITPEAIVSPTEVVPGAGELTEATSPFEDIPEESSSEQGFLAKAVDKIKSGSFTEGFAEIKNSSLYKGTLSALRSDFTKGLLAGAGLSAAGISAYEALLQEDEKGDLNLIPSDLKNLDKTLEKLNETFKLATEISKAKEGALQRFNQATLDPVRNRQRQNDLEKLEREDARIKGQLTEMKKKVETTMRLLKNKDAKNDKEIQREKAIKKTKEQADKRKVAQEVSALKRGVLQPRLQKDMAPKIKISINNSPKNRVDPVMNQTQM